MVGTSLDERRNTLRSGPRPPTGHRIDDDEVTRRQTRTQRTFMASSRPPRPPHRQHPHDPPSPDSNLGYQNSTDDANPHRGAGVRSSTATTPAAPVQAPPGFTIWPNWLRDRLTSDPHLNEPTITRAIRLYLELRGRFTNYPTGPAMPRRQTLATELRVSLKTIDRVLDVLRRVGAIRTTLLHDRRGHVTG